MSKHIKIIFWAAAACLVIVVVGALRSEAPPALTFSGFTNEGRVAVFILIRFQDETNSGRVPTWQDHVGLIHSS